MWKGTYLCGVAREEGIPKMRQSEREVLVEEIPEKFRHSEI